MKNSTACAVSLAAFLGAACEMPARPTSLSDAAAAPPTKQHGGSFEGQVPVLSFGDMIQFGTSQLIRTPNGVNFRVSVTGLEPGHAYTLWIVPFNAPERCGEPSAISLCGGSDVVNDAARPDMMYAAGRIASGTGTATFAGRLSVGDTGSVNAPAGLPAYGLLDPRGAEIQFFVHHHGPMLPAFMPDMIQTVAGGCTDAGIPEAGVNSPFNNYTGLEYGRRGPNTCTTIGFAAHKP